MWMSTVKKGVRRRGLQSTLPVPTECSVSLKEERRGLKLTVVHIDILIYI